MKIQEKNKLITATPAELKEKLTKLQLELSQLRLKLASGKTKNTRIVRITRQKIAVIKTFLTAKELIATSPTQE